MDLTRRTTRTDDGVELEYYVYPQQGEAFDRVLVYVHGLGSDGTFATMNFVYGIYLHAGFPFMPLLHRRLLVDDSSEW